jgi:uncharacterized protein YegP (UPF0339 family)
VPGKFVVKKGPTGKFRFSLVSTNGQIVVSSQAYETKRAAMGGVASVQKLATGAKIVDTTVAAAAPAKPAPKPAAKPAARKPAVRKPAVKKSAAKKSAARKPAVKRPAAKK